MQPTPFGPIRAHEIYAAAKRVMPWVDGLRHAMTPGETEYVMEVWRGMPGDTCFVDAFFRILHNEEPDRC